MRRSARLLLARRSGLRRRHERFRRAILGCLAVVDKTNRPARCRGRPRGGGTIRDDEPRLVGQSRSRPSSTTSLPMRCGKGCGWACSSHDDLMTEDAARSGQARCRGSRKIARKLEAIRHLGRNRPQGTWPASSPKTLARPARVDRWARSSGLGPWTGRRSDRGGRCEERLGTTRSMVCSSGQATSFPGRARLG